MYEDFYPYIPGSLDARQRIRKLRLKRLGYFVGACLVFGSGFIMGLVWHEPDTAETQMARQHDRQLDIIHTPPTEAFTSPPELSAPILDLQFTVPPEPERVEPADLAAKMNTDQTTTETTTSPLPSIALGLDTPVQPLQPQDQAPSQPEPSEPKVIKSAVNKPKVSKPKAPKPQKQAPPRQPYLVQIGAFRSEANARKIVAKLRDKGYQPFIRTVQNQQNLVLYRVFLDQAKDKAQAQATAKAFEETEKMDALVMLADGFSPSNPR
ncbi:MAG: hypothetical protein ETSY1_42760 [Candidatus Entotheonella factor]|uniref:SPOR domain-containing protein n=1 Tax=Entotheonella factor TaxID=1429438 RepID=W4L3M0_ENTF1|nr:SPOR domain-containing protein [Candidatus Entotheonella palauensis]ETW92642.1 MAG: hypothetical protein ETSY1_42760 [Candidatus Entotheonella factor]